MSFRWRIRGGLSEAFCGGNSAVGHRQRALAAAFRRLDFGIGLHAAGFERQIFGGELSVVAFCLRAFDDEFSVACYSGELWWLDLVNFFLERLTLNCGLLLAGFRPLTFGGGF